MAFSSKHPSPIIEHDEDGWWAYYAAGWCSASDPGLHADHEDTRRELNARIREAIRCECAQCRADIRGGLQ